MPKATAVWLIENTTVTFQQIADFCGMHPLEVKGIADGEVAVGIMGLSPLTSGELTKEEIKLAEEDGDRKLRLSQAVKNKITTKKKSKYTPIARRQDKPDAIAWFVKNYPNIKDSQLAKLIGTTKNTINSIRTRSHWNIQSIKPRDPVLLGLCSQIELDNVLAKLMLDDAKNDNISDSEQN